MMVASAWPSRRVLAQFAALALAWGSSFFFIKVALRGLSPAEVVLGRLSAGAAALLVVTAVTRQPLPRQPVIWAHLTVVAVLLCAVPFTLFGWAEEHVSSGLASVYNAATPLMTVLVALAALPEERPTGTKIAGLLAGFTGVLVVLGPWRGTGVGNGLAQGACLLATLCYGLAFVYLRRFVTPYRLPATSVAAVQVSAGAVLMAVLSPVYLTGPVRLSAPIIASVAVLGVAGTGLAYLWNTNIVAGWGATNAATVTYLTPLVGVVLGAVVLGEAITWNEPVGALIVIAGIALSQGRLLTAQAGANLRELMERMGHSSPRAALIYLHATTERQRALADTLGTLIESTMSERASDQHPSGTDVARLGQCRDDVKKPRPADLGF